jgi:uncharacterized protein (DUF302 family)
MSYYFNKNVSSDFETTIQNVTSKLTENGFGILTEIDVQETLNKKLDVDFYKYKILEACNPHFAHQALLIEDKVGVMLPCNVIVQQKSENDKVEVSVVDPVSSMQAIKNDKLAGISGEVRELLKQAIDNLE